MSNREHSTNLHPFVFAKTKLTFFSVSFNTTGRELCKEKDGYGMQVLQIKSKKGGVGKSLFAREFAQTLAALWL